MATCTAVWAASTLVMETEEARRRRRTPRSRSEARCTGSPISPTEAMTTARYPGT
jgi:hypothetical protein